MRSPRLVLLLTAPLALAGVSHRAGAQRSETLLGSKTFLELRIATDLGALMGERDSLKLKPHSGSISYVAADGRRVSIEVQLELRGHWRRQRKNCDFAPIKVDFPKGARSGTIFEDQGDLKLVTSGARPLSIFDLKSDPAEKNDLLDQPGVAEPLLARFRAFRSRLRPVRVDPKR